MLFLNVSLLAAYTVKKFTSFLLTPYYPIAYKRFYSADHDFMNFVY